MSQLNIFGSGYILDSLNVNQNLNINNYLRVYEVLGVKYIEIKNYGIIEKNLNLFKSTFISDYSLYPILDIKKSNDTTLNVKNDLNCFFHTHFENVYSNNNIKIKLDDNYKRNVIINSNININSLAISNYSLTNN